MDKDSQEIGCDFMGNYIVQYDSVNTNNLKILYLNARSIVRKLDDLEIIINKFSKLDAVVVTETWLQKSTTKFFNIHNFDAHHVTRPGVGGGVSIYVNNIWKSKVLHIVDNMQHSIIHVSISAHNYKFAIIAFYNPSEVNSNNFLMDLEELLLRFNHSDTCLLIGDANINTLLHSNSRDKYDTLAKSFNYQLCNKNLPTRITASSATQIDHIWLNNKDKSQVTLYNILNDFSDHNMLVVDVRRDDVTIQNKNNNRMVKLDIDYNKLNDYLSVQKLKRCFHDVNEYHNNLQIYLAEAVSKCAKSSIVGKFKTINSTLNKPWIDKKFLMLVKMKDILYSRTKCKNPSKIAVEDYKCIANQVTKYKRELQKSFYSKILANNCGPKQAWANINTILANKVNNSICIDELLIDDNKILENNKICESMNEYFVNIACKLAIVFDSNTLVDYQAIQRTKNSLFIAPTDECEVLKLIKGLKNHGKPNDGVLTNKLIKNCRHTLAPYLTDIINLSINSGIVPISCKTARVVPIHKAGAKNLPGNYRPISILPALSKLLEKVIKIRLMSFLTKYDVLNKYQYGFRTKHNTLNAIIDMLTPIQVALDESRLAGGLFIDLTKAFDTVNHKILLKKMECAGIRGTPLNWFTSYLDKRKQYVNINNTNSSSCTILHGVPQGSVLGPILFLLYINDIGTLDLTGKITLFADDILLTYIADTESNIMRSMQHDLDLLLDWFKRNKLTLNSDKTKYMFFHKKTYTPNSLNNVCIQGEIIERVNKIKYLGLVIDSNIKWTDHINYIKNKILPVLSVLHRLHYKGIKSDQLKSLYYALIHSHLTYLNEIWGTCHKNQLSILEVLQKRALKIIFNLPFRTHTIDVYKFTKIAPLNVSIRLNRGLYIYKIKFRLIVSNTQLGLVNELHSYNTRTRDKYVKILKKTTTYGINSVINQATKEFNLLPSELTNCKSISIFKKKLHAMLTLDYFST